MKSDVLFLHLQFLVWYLPNKYVLSTSKHKTWMQGVPCCYLRSCTSYSYRQFPPPPPSPPVSPPTTASTVLYTLSTRTTKLLNICYRSCCHMFSSYLKVWSFDHEAACSWSETIPPPSKYSIVLSLCLATDNRGAWDIKMWRGGRWTFLGWRWHLTQHQHIAFCCIVHI